MVTQGSTQNKLNLVVDHANATAVLTLLGDWTVRHLPTERELDAGGVGSSINKLIVNGSQLGEVDASGAWLLLRAVRKLPFKQEQIEWIGFTESQQKILHLILEMKHEPLQVPGNFLYRAMVNLGRYTLDMKAGTGKLVGFYGQWWLSFLRTLRQPSRLRVKSVFYHVHEIGIQAIPIVVLMAFFISLVLGYQGANQLRQFGAKEYTINLVAISHLREMGVLISAIMLAGRSCSAFAAQIGVMRMNEEVAALRTLGLDPFELLVLPRVIAIMIALPVLTFIADIAGLVGTYFVAWVYLDLSYAQFYDRVHHAVTDMTFYVGLMKAPVFAFCIGMIGCYQGLQVRTSATELGLRTTAAVVQSIFWIVLMDAIFSVIFTSLNL